MTIHLDHTIVPSHSSVASAKLLAELLGVPWAESGADPFVPVYVNDGLTLDFQDTDETFPVYHFCFRVSPQDFDAILGRIKAASIKYRSTVRGPVDMRVDAQYGNVYWNEPDGHQWEMLTVSYARQVRNRVIPAQAGIQLKKNTPRESGTSWSCLLRRVFLIGLDSGLRRNDASGINGRFISDYRRPS